jgi:hypothetical protein
MKTKFFVSIAFAGLMLAAGDLGAQFADFYLESPVLESGADLQAGAIYRFSNVTTGYDALLSIDSLANGAAVTLLDETSPASPTARNFQPSIQGTPSLDPMAYFTLTFVTAGTSTPSALSNVRLSGLDVDTPGTLEAREVNIVAGGATYTVESARDISGTVLPGGLVRFEPFNPVGMSPNLPTNTTIAYSVDFTDPVTSLNFQLGIAGTNTGSYTRQFSIGSEPIPYTDPVVYAVPEPSSLLLCAAAGLAGFFGSRRRKTALPG